MKRQVLFVQGAGAEGYQADAKLAAHLRTSLGAGYELRYPKMSTDEHAMYETWKRQIMAEIRDARSPGILVGHSFGASTVLKLLSEESPGQPIAGVFLISTPYWEIEEYKLRPDFAAHLPRTLPLYFYQGRDDEEVPFAHFKHYQRQLPWAVFRALDGRGHQLNDDLSEVAQDIRALDHHRV